MKWFVNINIHFVAIKVSVKPNSVENHNQQSTISFQLNQFSDFQRQNVKMVKRKYCFCIWFLFLLFITSQKSRNSEFFEINLYKENSKSINTISHSHSIDLKKITKFSSINSSFTGWAHMLTISNMFYRFLPFHL